MAKERTSTKKAPLRTCAACRQKFDKRELVRLVYTPSVGLEVDLTQRKNGRGTYLCKNPACWDRARTTSVLDRALKVSLSAEERQGLTAP